MNSKSLAFGAMMVALLIMGPSYAACDPAAVDIIAAEGQEVTVHATPDNPGAYKYDWAINGAAAGDDDPTLTFTATETMTSISVIITSDVVATCMDDDDISICVEPTECPLKGGTFCETDLPESPDSPPVFDWEGAVNDDLTFAYYLNGGSTAIATPANGDYALTWGEAGWVWPDETTTKTTNTICFTVYDEEAEGYLPGVGPDECCATIYLVQDPTAEIAQV